MNISQVPLHEWTKEQFLSHFDHLYESSPWIAEAAWEQAPFYHLQEILDAMEKVVQQIDDEKKLQLLRQHPDLGSRIQMTEHSQSEQAGAGLDQLTAEQYETLTHLNKEYTERYQFPFILAVKGKNAQQILDTMNQRMKHPAAEEFVTALEQVHIIVGLRMQTWADQQGLTL